jgi:hypothetical protein
MSTAEAARTREGRARGRRGRRSPSAFAVILALVLGGALVLRVWGLHSGLPWIYNVDEGAHFVPRAIGMFDHSYDPGYFINPPALTYLFHLAFWIRWGGDGVREQFAGDPSAVWAFARGIVAVLGTLSVGLLAWAGARFFDRRVALVAAALMAVAFLPVHYAHFALNDAPTLVPVCLALAGTAGVLRGGRTRAFVLAGLGLGLATATKYTAGMVLLPLVAAAALAPLGRAARVRGLVVAGVVAIVAFVVANPYALLDFHTFKAGLSEQSAASSDGGGKLGLSDEHGLSYYAGTLFWGLGFVPVAAALAGAIWMARRDRRTALVLVPAPVLFLAFMGSQDRFFARWLLPIYPILILLAAWAAVELLALVREKAGVLQRVPAWSPAVVAAVVLGVQGLVYAVHNDRVLAATDTRALARAWMVATIPEGSKIVLEPITPAPFVRDLDRPSRATSTGDRWIKRRISHFRVKRSGELEPLGEFRLEDYERTLRPALVGSYLRGGYCWVITGSTQYGRALAEPGEAPWAIRYYDELRRRGDVVFEAGPFERGADEPPFSFDDSFNYRPLGYVRPGPRIVVYRLHGGRCT